MTRQPDLRRAEEEAYHTLLAENAGLPVRPASILRRRADTTLHTYAEMADRLHLPPAAFDRRYGDADAFTLRCTGAEGSAYAVAYRADGNPARLNFTLAHELGHIVLNHHGAEAADEREADHFASCLLCPRHVLQDIPDDAVLAKICYVTLAAARMARQRPRPMMSEQLWKSLAAHMRRTKCE